MSHDVEAAAECYVVKRGFSPRPSSSGANSSDLMTLLFAEGEARVAFKAGVEWALDAARNPEPKPEDGVLCTDCDKIVTDVKQIVVKGDRAVHFNCPGAERHGELAEVSQPTRAELYHDILALEKQIEKVRTLCEYWRDVEDPSSDVTAPMLADKICEMVK
jgi:hypothetical protein